MMNQPEIGAANQTSESKMKFFTDADFPPFNRSETSMLDLIIETLEDNAKMHDCYIPLKRQRNHRRHWAPPGKQ